MKSFVLALLFSTSAFAANICDLRDSHDLAEQFKEISRTEGEDFSAGESAMIFVMMKKYSDGWRTYKNEYEAMFDFLDYDRYNDRELVKGTNGGEIVYYNVNGKKIALVHFWPGDNEYGSVFEVLKNGKAQHLARITDGEVYCQ